MRTFILMVAIGMFFAIAPLNAQYEYAKDGFAARAVFTNYQWPALKSDFDSDDVTTGMRLEYSRHLNDLLNFAVPLTFTKAYLPTDENGTFTTSGLTSLDALLQLKWFREPSFIYPYLYAGLGVVAEDFEDFHVVAPLGAALNFRLAKHVYLSGTAEYRIGFKDLRDNFQVSAGLLLLLGPGAPVAEPVTDRDGDGIPDGQDLCPDIAGPASFNGCPDADGDGIPDVEDQCPDVFGVALFGCCPDTDGDGIRDSEDACPEQAGALSAQGCPDTDGDGILDNVDLCPTEAGMAGLNGCPDRDRDGVADRDDLCPDLPGLIMAKGCPDTDGDGVIDSQDNCPNSPGPASNNGCPEITKEEAATLSLAAEAVQFQTGSARLLSESLLVLDEITGILRRYPDAKMRISGHTDSTGGTETNQRLSESRAKACYDYLISKGISPGRLSYAGYGESQPIADNRYEEGRRKNRRVVFDLYN